MIKSHYALISAIEAHGKLLSDDRNAIMAIRLKARSFISGDFIGREGRPDSACAILVEGFAVRQKTTRLGGRQIVSLHGPGDALTLQNAFLGFPDYDVRSVGDCVVSFVDASAIRTLAAERPAVAHSFLVGAFTEASTAREWMLNIGRRSARTRLAHFLCEYLDRISFRMHPVDGKYVLQLTQEQIADAIGMTAVHVNRMLKGLQTDKLIKQLGRFLTVPDMTALKEAGEYGDSYRYLPSLEHALPDHTSEPRIGMAS